MLLLCLHLFIRCFFFSISLIQKEIEKQRNKKEKRKGNTVEGTNTKYVRFGVPIMVSMVISIFCNVTTILHRRR
jgi:hypothetical protein